MFVCIYKMGQGDSQPDDRLCLYVMNCSSKTCWVQTSTEKENMSKIEPNRRLHLLSMTPQIDVNVYSADKNTLVTSVVPVHGDLLIYISSKTIDFYDWPLLSEYKRPFYLMVQGSVDPVDLDSLVSDGANAVEVPVMFDEGNQYWYVGEKMTVTLWFEAVKKCAGIQFVQVSLPSSCTAAWKIYILLEQIRRSKYKQGILISVSGTTHWNEVEKKLHSHEGLSTNFLSVSKDVMERFPEDANIWFGATSVRGMAYEQTRDAVFLRTNGKKLKKVLAGVVDNEVSFLSYLQLDVDSILVTRAFVSQARALVGENPFYRMAMVTDDPFEKTQIDCTTLARRKKNTMKHYKQP